MANEIDPESYKHPADARRDAADCLNLLTDGDIENGLDLPTMALYKDAVGLLVGMGNGTITKGVSRLADDLISLAQQHPNGAKLKKELLTAILTAAHAGLSVDGVDLAPAKQRELGYRSR